MQELNVGSITLNRPLSENEAKVLNDMVDEIADTDSAELVFEEYYSSDIRADVEEILEYLKGLNITANGCITKYGDYPSDIMVKNNEIYEEVYRPISEVSDEEIRSEYKDRFGKKYVITVGGDFVRANQTFKNDECRSSEEALRKAENGDGDYDDDSEIEIFVCTVNAENSEEAIKKAEQLAPYYRYMMTAREV